MKKVIITGISGTLGQALGKEYLQKGWQVIGVTRQNKLEGDFFSELCSNDQSSVADAQKILDYQPDVIILNAGQIETEVGAGGIPLTELSESMNRVNFTWPAVVALEAAKRSWTKPLQIIAIGSIADGSPSCFGPVYHAGKIAVHYFWSGVGPIMYHASKQNIRMRLYRPGAVKGPLAWAPVNRLNKTGYKIRARRVNSAPSGEQVARKIIKWVDKGKGWVGTYDEPFSFKIFKYLFVLFPNQFYKLQLYGWRKGSKFYQKEDNRA